METVERRTGNEAQRGQPASAPAGSEALKQSVDAAAQAQDERRRRQRAAAEQRSPRPQSFD